MFMSVTGLPLKLRTDSMRFLCIKITNWGSNENIVYQGVNILVDKRLKIASLEY